MSRRRLASRRWTDRMMTVLTAVAAGIALIPLLSILTYAVKNGLPALNWAFLTNLPKPVGEPGGGMGNAILGTITLVSLASALGVPAGVLAGVYLAEYGGRGRLATAVRFAADVLTGVPSIVTGIFVYAFIVLEVRHFSAFAGGVALAIIMMPVVTRSTEEMLRLVPDSLREASLALGVPRWRTIVSVVLPSAGPGLLTGALLAVARVAGETAPLLFTAFNNRYWQTGLNAPIASLPVQIFTYAIAPYEDWHQQAWAGALVLILMVLLLSITARAFTYSRSHR